MQPSVQYLIWPVTEQEYCSPGEQIAQSATQEPQVSKASQEPSPQTGPQGPQSAGQVLQSSVPLQEPSGQEGGQAPQSAGQVLQVSVPLQEPSGQEGPPPDAIQLPQAQEPLQVWVPAAPPGVVQF